MNKYFVFILCDLYKMHKEFKNEEECSSININNCTNGVAEITVTPAVATNDFDQIISNWRYRQRTQYSRVNANSCCLHVCLAMLELICGFASKLKNALRGYILLFLDSGFLAMLVFNFILASMTFIPYALGYGLHRAFIYMIPATFTSFIFEACNTVVEKLCDFIHPDYSKQIKNIKDMSAAMAATAHLAPLVTITFIYCDKYNWI